MSQPSLILKLEKTFAEKLYPEVLRLKKELGMDFFYFTESLYIDKKNAFKRREICQYGYNSCDVTFDINKPLDAAYHPVDRIGGGITYTYSLFSSNIEFINFCEEVFKKLNELEKKKETILKIIKMDVSYKKELLTEKIK